MPHQSRWIKVATAVILTLFIASAHAEEIVERASGRAQPHPAEPAPKTTPQTPPNAQQKKLAEQFDGGSRWAVIVGVNKYTDPKMSSLRFCVPDAKLMAEVLQKKCGYAKENILLMTDDGPADLQPTKANLQKQIPTWLKKTGPRDTILVYFAGHGSVLRGQSALIPQDFESANPGLSSYRVDELRDALHDSNAAQKLLVLDCCHGGGAKAGIALALSGEDLGGAKTAGGLITFTGSRKTQTSLESAEKGHGVFTWCLARGLGGEADFDKDGIVDSDEIYRFVFSEVPATAKEVDPKHEQQPVRIIGEDVIGVFALARVSGDPVVTPPKIVKLKVGEAITNSIGMKLTLVPAGNFKFGSPKSEAERDDDETQWTAYITQPMFVGIHEVTQGQYAKVMKKNPSFFSKDGSGAKQIAEVKDPDSLPVEQVTWDEAVEFCKKLNKLPEEQAAGRGYRLPTEAEWEYFCRAATTTPFNTGELISPNQANVDGDKPYLNSADGPSLKRTTPVGSYKPNAWGIHDTHGNVWEWVSDRYAENPHHHTPFARDPTGPVEGDQRVVRGGAFAGDVALCRSASRRNRDPDYRNKSTGFRVVCVMVGKIETQ
jgi:formylglycine-generating enzyme required for sulfatase activity